MPKVRIDKFGGVNTKQHATKIRDDQATKSHHVDTSHGDLRSIAPTDTGTDPLSNGEEFYSHVLDDYTGEANANGYVDFNGLHCVSIDNADPKGKDGTNTYDLGVEQPTGTFTISEQTFLSYLTDKYLVNGMGDISLTHLDLSTLPIWEGNQLATPYVYLMSAETIYGSEGVPSVQSNDITPSSDGDAIQIDANPTVSEPNKLRHYNLYRAGGAIASWQKRAQLLPVGVTATITATGSSPNPYAEFKVTFSSVPSFIEDSLRTFEVQVFVFQSKRNPSWNTGYTISQKFGANWQSLTRIQKKFNATAQEITDGFGYDGDTFWYRYMHDTANADGAVILIRVVSIEDGTVFGMARVNPNESANITSATVSNALFFDTAGSTSLINVQPTWDNGLPQTGIANFQDYKYYLVGHYEKRLLFSAFGDANAWPIDYYLELPITIRCHKVFNGEIVIWGDNQIYRAYGSYPAAMTYELISDAIGMDEDHWKTITEVRNNLLFVGKDNHVWAYDGQSVVNITKNIVSGAFFSSIGYASAIEHDSKYILARGNAMGVYVLDLSDFSDIKHTYCYEDLRDTTISRAVLLKDDTNEYPVSPLGLVLGGDAATQWLRYNTKYFDFNTPDRTKLLHSFTYYGEIYASGGTITIRDLASNTELISQAIPEGDYDEGIKYVVPASYKKFNILRLELSSFNGIVRAIELDVDPLDDEGGYYRYHGVAIKFTGTVTISFYANHNATPVISETLVANTYPGSVTDEVDVRTLYFPDTFAQVMTYASTETSGEILEITYEKERIL